MKATIIIEDGTTTIVLKPETPYEKGIIEQMHEDKSMSSEVVAEVETDWNSYKREYTKHRIEIKTKYK